MKMKFNNLLSLILIVASTFYSTTIRAEKIYDLGNPVLIRPFGDSITYGVGFSDWGACPVMAIGQFLCMPPAQAGGGYRGWMTLLSITRDGIVFTTEGYQSGGSYVQQWMTNTQTHDGYPGWRNDQLAQIANYSSFANITLVHSGTNDILQNKTPTAAVADLFKVINNLLNHNKTTHLFIAQIIRIAPPFPKYETMNQNIFEYNKLIVNHWINLPPSSQSRISIVDMHHTLDLNSDYSADGIHPNAKGYMKMACSWIRALKSSEPNQENPCLGITTDEIEKRMSPSKTDIKRMIPPKDKLEQLIQGQRGLN